MRNFYVFCFLVSGICFSGTTNADPKCLTKSELTPPGEIGTLTGVRCYGVTKTILHWINKSDKLVPLESYKHIDNHCEYDRFINRISRYNGTEVVLTDEMLILAARMFPQEPMRLWAETGDESHLKPALGWMKICSKLVLQFGKN